MVSESPQGSLRDSVALDGAAVIAAASALGYLIAYVDRLGEAFVYRIPLDYVAVSATDALSRTSIVIVALGVVIGCAEIELKLGKRVPVWARDALSTASTWVLLSLLSLVLTWEPLVTAGCALVGLLWTGGQAARGYLRRRNVKLTPSVDVERRNEIPVLGKTPKQSRLLNPPLC